MGPDSNGTMLAFLIHNLDTGITAVIEDAWDEYVRESHTATCATKPSTGFAAKGSKGAAGLNASTRSCSKSMRNQPQRTHQRCADGGSFWLLGRQQQALRALGKA